MKMLVSDFDNTLFVDDKQVLDKNIDMIRKFINNGNIFVIITGRSYFDIKILLNKYNILYSYLICEDGARIYNSTDYCIFSSKIDSDIVNNIIKICNKYSYEYLLDDGYNYTNNIYDCVKIVVPYVDYVLANKFLDEINVNNLVSAYISNKYININSFDINKEYSLSKLINIEKIDYDLYVIGDGINDYEMIKKYNGVIMDDHCDILNVLNTSSYKYLYLYILELLK